MQTFKGQRVRKITPEQDFIEKETAFLRMKPQDRLAWNVEIQRKIWGKAFRKSSFRKMKVFRKTSDSSDVQ
jgi:hypothetical protein